MRWLRSPLCRAPQLLNTSQALREEEVQQCKSTKSDCPGTRLLFAPWMRHINIRIRLAICHAHGELERETGGSQRPPDYAGRQRAEMLPTTALPCCLWLSQHVCSIFHFQHWSWVAGGYSTGATRGKMSCKKPCSRQSRAKNSSQLKQLLTSQLLQHKGHQPPDCSQQ